MQAQPHTRKLQIGSAARAADCAEEGSRDPSDDSMREIRVKEQEKPNGVEISIAGVHKHREKKQKVQRECRICLTGEEEGRIVQPCLCLGSISFAHEKCLAEWIGRQSDPKGPRARVSCELCHTPFRYRLAKRRQIDCSEYLANYKKQKRSFVLFFLLLLFMLVCDVTLIVLIAESSNEDSEFGAAIRKSIIRSQSVRIVCICIVFLILILLMFMSIMFVIEYAVRTQVLVTEVANYSEPELRRKVKIYQKQVRNETMSE